MADGGSPRLNDSGEDGVSHLIARGAVHFSRGQATARHASNAWKIHVGIDAPVWLDSDEVCIAPSAGARVVVTPPNLRHATGAVGWSLAVFVAPGSRMTPWRGAPRVRVLDGSAARRMLDLCRHGIDAPSHTPGIVDEVARLSSCGLTGPIDGRVMQALESIRRDPHAPLSDVARSLGISLDRLTRLTTAGTDLPLRRHVLWSRLLAALAQRRAPTLAAVAMAAGFADHAHMTRTYRAFLGRAPSEFTRPPDVLAPW